MVLVIGILMIKKKLLNKHTITILTEIKYITIIMNKNINNKIRIYYYILITIFAQKYERPVATLPRLVENKERFVQRLRTH